MILTAPLKYEYPVIVSSVLIQGWDQRHQWLSYQEYFQSNQWKLCISYSGQNILNKSGILSTSLKGSYTNVESFETDFQDKLLKKNHICELLRLTVSGTIRQKVYYLYLAQKHLAKAVYDLGYDFCLTIIEQPFLLNYYENLNNNSYISTSCYQMDNTGDTNSIN
ncbi:Acyl-homoserine-lactone synthase LuxM [Vibrio marisflavi CECT 7928]|uniref:acyl-homoserine-lactone synthase n=1 Tax=Vibrio marisflavi CECT 7928 TaxID=634439 RepID=A0ABN8E9A8_9VIBR|nr:Acyl-homoserine-lactone synthase LuxM [Vibrio marisflavi CECT 7928]